MKVKKIAASFKTTDGQEFDAEEKACAHQCILNAEAAWKEACRVYGEALLGANRTADGGVVKFDLFADYWYITPGYGGMPSLRSVSFYRWNCQYELGDGLTILQHGTDGRQIERFPVGKLYVSKRNAEAALKNARVAWLEERRREIEG